MELNDDVSSHRNWLDLPTEITASILSQLGVFHILNTAQLVCMSWRKICLEPSMWRRIDMGGDDYFDGMDLELLCQHAVDRSCGGLLHICIQHFGTDQLLHYISLRAENLKSLRMVECYSVSDEGFSEAIRKFPLLEEIELSYGNASKESVEAAGRACPLLKSFKLNNHDCAEWEMKCNDEALAIAETMPGLRHLQIFGNLLGDEGLCAILDGCPQLESLDVRGCFNVNLDGTLGKRCAERLKDFHRDIDRKNDYDDYPFSSEEDYPYGFSDIDSFSDYDIDDYYEFSDWDGFTDFDIY